jgi:hypothetical protein
MVAFEGNGVCREARVFYHDFLQDRAVVPKSVADHIDGCAHCRAQVQRLEQAMGEAANAGNPHCLNHSSQLIAELEAHFEYVGEQVACNQVKRFLPGLLADRVRIPTPITVHVDQCDQCTEDLERLRSLGLTQEQLARLGELYAEPARADLSLCRQVEVMLAEADDPGLEEIPATLAEHICSCPQCRERVYGAREDLLDLSKERPAVGPHVGCRRVMTADIFDFVVLPGEDAVDQASAADRRRAIGEHVFYCAECLEKVQNLHRVIYGIAERADSGVATVYATKEAVLLPAGKSHDPYAAYPINVSAVGGRIRSPGRRSRRTSSLAALLRQTIRVRGLRRFIPATALIVVAALLVGLYALSSRSASGLNIGQLNRAVSERPNVHISITWRFASGLQARADDWISSSELVISQEREGQQSLIYDTEDRLKITASWDRSQVQKAAMTGNEYRRAMDAFQRKLSFGSAALSEKAELRPQTGSADGNSPELDVYEIVSPRTVENGESMPSRTLVYIERATNLLKRMEVSQENPDETRSQETILYEYPTDQEILQHFNGIIDRK